MGYPRHDLISRALAVVLCVVVALGVGLFAARAWARPIKVTWEADQPLKQEDPWTKYSASKSDKTKLVAAGDSYIRYNMLWPPKERPKDAKVPPAQLVYEFDVPSTDVYYFWAKVYWGIDECHNSFWIGFDKDVPAADWASLSHDARTPKEKAYLFGEDAVYLRWHWVRFNSGDLATGGGVKLTDGKHRLYLRAREDGLSIDKFLLTNDRDYVATGRNG
jgi:hypothetical protein